VVLGSIHSNANFQAGRKVRRKIEEEKGEDILGGKLERIKGMKSGDLWDILGGKLERIKDMKSGDLWIKGCWLV